MSKPIKIVLNEGGIAGVFNLAKGQDYTIVNVDNGYTYCDSCDDYFLDDERCECEEG